MDTNIRTLALKEIYNSVPQIFQKDICQLIV